MKPFTSTNHCLSKVHCRTCRDKENGRKWRESLANVFAIDAVDFECPYGYEWGYEPAGKTQSAPCSGCGRKRGTHATNSK